MEGRRYSMPYAIATTHISTKSSKRIFKTEETEVDSSPVIYHPAANKLKIIGKSKSLTESSTKLTSLSQTYLSADHSDNLLPSNKAQKKPMLIRAEAIDLPGISGSSDTYNISAHSRIKHDVRPHLLVSFFAKHFEKMHKRMTKRPLGSSLSFDLDERQRMHVLQRGHGSQDESIISLPVNIKDPNSLHIGLNCFHCLINASLRERKLSRLENGSRLLSSSNSPNVVHCINSRQRSSQKFNTNCKISFHDSIRIINK
uniref:Uncharacterized protein n=1 Tax=Elaeophora elaphi TaxID=1147741 RepID=A0A0R3RUD1_9BILA